MADFTSIIENIRHLPSFSVKTRFLTVILNTLQNKKVKITPKDKIELSTFAFEEIKNLIELIPTVQTYQEKDKIFGYEDNLLGIVMLCNASPAEINETDLTNIKTLVALIDKERFVENAIDQIFQNKQNDTATVSQLLASVIPLKDEYQKGQVYQGLLHVQTRTVVEENNQDLRVLVKAPIDFLEVYPDAVLTVNFEGVEVKPLVQKFTSAYTSVLALGEAVPAGEGYAFMGIVVTGVPKEVTGVSATVTYNGVTFDLGSAKIG